MGYESLRGGQLAELSPKVGNKDAQLPPYPSISSASFIHCCFIEESALTSYHRR